jgi:hypothetical protein
MTAASIALEGGLAGSADEAHSASDDEHSDDDVDGPVVMGASGMRIGAGVPSSNSSRSKASETRNFEQAAAAAVPEGGREEWMMVPPKSLGVLGALQGQQPTNRCPYSHHARVL